MAIIIDEIQEISTEGFQVVSGDFFKGSQKTGMPTATIWYNSISFSKAALTALNSCERIRIEININTRGMLIIPVTAKDKDSVRWTKNKKEPITRKIECRAFTSKLFDSWDWDKESVYKATGRIVTSDSKVMLLFEFNKPENWKLCDNLKGKQ